MGSNYTIPSQRALPHTPDNCSSPPKGRLLTPEPATSEKQPAQIRPARLATRKHRSSSIVASEEALVRVELDGEGRRMEKRARVEKRAGSLDEKMGRETTLRRRQSREGDPFRTPELRVVNIDV